MDPVLQSISYSVRSQSTNNTQKKTTRYLPAYFVRGGTSNGLIIKRSDLPEDIQEWQPILASCMGAPDPYIRQLNGMGQGISSTSKVCVIETSKRPGVDVDYTFVQVGIKGGDLDFSGNCGNMSSAVGPIAFDWKLYHNATVLDDNYRSLRIYNTNTKKVIESTFRVNYAGDAYDSIGDYSIDGVPSTCSRITLSFLDPAGSRTGKALPTDHAVDVLTLDNGDTATASLVDVGNPGIYVSAADAGIDGESTPAQIEANAPLMAWLERVRRAGAARMGLDPNAQAVPKINIVSTPSPSLAAEGVNVVCRALSMQQAHKAIPITIALNLAAACRVQGTIPQQLALFSGKAQQSVVIAHASGKLEVGSAWEDDKLVSAQLHRTTRILMKGEVPYEVAA